MIAAGVVGCAGGRAVALHDDILGGERLLQGRVVCEGCNTPE